MSPSNPETATTIFLAPAPRKVREIFDDGDLARLRRLGRLIVHEDGDVDDAVFAAQAADATAPASPAAEATAPAKAKPAKAKKVAKQKKGKTAKKADTTAK